MFLFERNVIGRHIVYAYTFTLYCFIFNTMTCDFALTYSRIDARKTYFRNKVMSFYEGADCKSHANLYIVI